MAAQSGSSGNDTLNGTSGADTLSGLAGNDVYIVNHLGDVIVEAANAGTDTIRTSLLDALSTYSLASWTQVENLTYTGTLAAQLKGNALANLISANSALSVSDTLYGGAGNDTLYGWGGNDMLIGGSGNDVLDGGIGSDTMIGGTGNDTYTIDASTDRVFEYTGGGIDTIRSAVAKDLRLDWTAQVEGLAYTGSTAATLYGNALGNQITSGSATADRLYGFDGNDTLNGGSGTDTMVGGLGDDTYFVSSTDVVSEAVDQGRDTLVGTRTDLSLSAFATRVENLFYTSATGASLLGNGLDNVISGAAGADTVGGGEGNDTLLGGAGIDSLLGGNGDDVLYGGGNPDYVWTADRRLVADTAADRLLGGNGNDRYLIDSSADVVVEASTGGSLDVVVSSIDNSLSRYAHVEALVLQRGSDAWFAQGTAGANILVGNERDNLLVGGAGNDTLSAFVNVAGTLGAQSDVLDAGDGNDVLIAFGFGSHGGAASEVNLLGGAGDDIYLLGTPAATCGGTDSAGNDTAILLASGSIESLAGVENVYLFGADPLIDAVARNALNPVYAAANGGSGYTAALGNAYNATGNALANRIVGNRLDNLLSGGAGNDSLSAGLGNDTLDGGSGTDSLTGGAGDDWYLLDTGDVAVESANSGFDVLASATITSFTGYANFEGLQYLGATAVNLNRGSGNTSADYLGGGSGQDTLSGFGGNDTLDGGAGNDNVSGGAANDSLRGGLGDDSLLGGTESDTLDGGDGLDSLYGELGDDSLRGGTGADLLDGGGNQDSLDGGDGADTLYGGDATDSLAGGGGDDLLFGDDGNDVLSGNDGSDQLFGGAVTVDDVLAGNGDHLWGGDRLGSGDGSVDLFAFDALGVANTVQEQGVGSGNYAYVGGATIGDFEAGLDRIAVAKDYVGDFDTVIDTTVEKALAGGTFSATAELVLVRADVADDFATSNVAFFDPISVDAVLDAIGSADAALALGERRLFVVDDGNHSAVFLFQSSDGNSTIGGDELFLLGVVTGQTELAAGDFLLF